MFSYRWFARTGMTLLAVVLALAGAGLIWFATNDSGGEPTAPSFTGSEITPTATRTPTSRASQRPGSGPAGVPDDITGPVLAESVPAEISIPRLGVHSRLVRLGVDGTGAMEVPQTAGAAGWYTLGPSPGALGPAVIAGHVDWNGEPAVFYRLGTMRAGDRVSVARADGRTAVFSVTRVARYAKADFPTAAVFGSIDHAGLRLITCGGDFDQSIHHYKDNVVVFANLVSDRRTTG
jgi:Sortase domain